MGVGVRINKNGVTELDGASGLQVASHPNNRGFLPAALRGPVASTDPVNNGAFTVIEPGFYLFSGSLTTTGTIPTPSDFPGAMLMFGRAITSSGPMLLTGSARTSGVNGVFSVNTAISGTFAGSAIGDKLTINADQGGLMLWSDGRLWIPVAASGSFSIA